uniref:PEST proteolytic signal-containing nuclear protein n=1 Tax=Rhinopithecus bieti TaxID=61621 RepID=A0A2K6LV98_RHIBE
NGSCVLCFISVFIAHSCISKSETVFSLSFGPFLFYILLNCRRSNGGESSSRSAEKRSAEEAAADLPTKPTKISKFGFAIGSQTTKKASAISIKLGSSKPKETVPTLAPKTLSVAAEMPPEAKMRMKNIGRDTPTSAGPNSFNKGKHGFSDNQKLWERNIKSHLGNVHDQDN